MYTFVRVILVALMLGWGSAALAEQVQISRFDAIAAANALQSIGKYQCQSATTPATTDCYFKATIPVRSALSHDYSVLSQVAREAAIGATLKGPDLAKWADQKLSVDLTKVSEGDLNLGENPQITIQAQSALLPLLSK